MLGYILKGNVERLSGLPVGSLSDKRIYAPENLDIGHLVSAKPHPIKARFATPSYVARVLALRPEDQTPRPTVEESISIFLTQYGGKVLVNVEELLSGIEAQVHHLGQAYLREIPFGGFNDGKEHPHHIRCINVTLYVKTPGERGYFINFFDAAKLAKVNFPDGTQVGVFVEGYNPFATDFDAKLIAEKVSEVFLPKKSRKHEGVIPHGVVPTLENGIHTRPATAITEIILPQYGHGNVKILKRGDSNQKEPYRVDGINDVTAVGARKGDFICFDYDESGPIGNIPSIHGQVEQIVTNHNFDYRSNRPPVENKTGGSKPSKPGSRPNISSFLARHKPGFGQ